MWNSCSALSSPWDLAVVDRLLFVAMAGTHQIWVIDLARGLAFPYAGSGREARVDGAADAAAFAQPSGLAVHDGTLFVADAESNIIRAIELPPINSVATIAGGDLFEFGDKDGAGDAVRFQHPLGVAWAGDRLFVADTYNHKIREVDPSTRRVRTFAGSGVAGDADGRASRAQASGSRAVLATAKGVGLCSQLHTRPPPLPAALVRSQGSPPQRRDLQGPR